MQTSASDLDRKTPKNERSQILTPAHLHVNTFYAPVMVISIILDYFL